MYATLFISKLCHYIADFNGKHLNLLTQLKNSETQQQIFTLSILVIASLLSWKKTSSLQRYLLNNCLLLLLQVTSSHSTLCIYSIYNFEIRVSVFFPLKHESCYRRKEAMWFSALTILSSQGIANTSLAYGQKISAGTTKKGRLLSIGQRVAKQTIASFLPGNFNFGNGHKYVIWLRYLLA